MVSNGICIKGKRSKNGYILIILSLLIVLERFDNKIIKIFP